jgi:mannose-6-phosphate isomerase-like protein (cupin superfamily)
MKFVFPTTGAKHYRFPTHTNHLVVDREESQTSEVFVVVLAPGEAPPLHLHDDTEQVFYILEGEGILRIGSEKQEFPVRAADVVRIPPATLHSIQCTGKKPLRYLAIDCFVNGRPAVEPTWDSHVRVVCHQNGWNFAEITRRANHAE